MCTAIALLASSPMMTLKADAPAFDVKDACCFQRGSITARGVEFAHVLPRAL